MESSPAIKDHNSKLITHPMGKANSPNSYYAFLFSCERNNPQIQSIESGKPFTISINTIFLSFSLLIGWQISIWICCKSSFSLLYNCQLLCIWRLALRTVVEVFPRHFFLDIAPSRMFTTNSLCLIICPIHEWRLFFKMFKSNLSSFAPCKLHHLLFYLFIFFLTFLSSTMFQMH
jgi:hypothetical protein